MKSKSNKQLNKLFLEHSFHELLGAGEKYRALSKEATFFFIGVFLFLSGFLFNLSASIVYDLIKDSKGWKILILAVTGVSLVVLIWLIQKYVMFPIRKQKGALKKVGQDTHEAMNRVINDTEESNED